MPRLAVESRDTGRVSVGWAGGRDVQVGVHTPGDRSVMRQLLTSPTDPVDDGIVHLAESILATCARHPIPVGTLTAPMDAEEPIVALHQLGCDLLDLLDEISSALSSLWCHLEDRRQVNDLIKILRQARDGAFGRDA